MDSEMVCSQCGFFKGELGDKGKASRSECPICLEETNNFEVEVSSCGCGEVALHFHSGWACCGGIMCCPEAEE